MWLIVGLGNPGRDYAATPHNLGFAVLERLAEATRVHRREQAAESFLLRGRLDGRDVLLAQPQTYMNRSGVAVKALLRREQLTAVELVVVTDDFALPWGAIRIRQRGSDGGHNGLRSIIAELETQEFLRVRLGCQPEGPVGELADYVLTPVGAETKRLAAEMVDQAAEAVRVLLREGASRAMSRFNRRVGSSSLDGRN